MYFNSTNVIIKNSPTLNRALINATNTANGETEGVLIGLQGGYIQIWRQGLLQLPIDFCSMVIWKPWSFGTSWPNMKPIHRTIIN